MQFQGNTKNLNISLHLFADDCKMTDMDSATSEFWQRLRAARRYADLTQADIATAAGVSRSAVAQWEAAETQHRTRPSAENIIIISKLTNAPLDWLMNDSSVLEDIYKLAALNDASNLETVKIASPSGADVLPDMKHGDQLFLFAQTPEQAANKLALAKAADSKQAVFLIFVGLGATVASVQTPSDALLLVASKLSK